jgi:hypothetical protein
MLLIENPTSRQISGRAADPQLRRRTDPVTNAFSISPRAAARKARFDLLGAQYSKDFRHRADRIDIDAGAALMIIGEDPSLEDEIADLLDQREPRWNPPASSSRSPDRGPCVQNSMSGSCGSLSAASSLPAEACPAHHALCDSPMPAGPRNAKALIKPQHQPLGDYGQGRKISGKHQRGETWRRTCHVPWSRLSRPVRPASRQ